MKKLISLALSEPRKPVSEETILTVNSKIQVILYTSLPLLGQRLSVLLFNKSHRQNGRHPIKMKCRRQKMVQTKYTCQRLMKRKLRAVLNLICKQMFLQLTQFSNDLIKLIESQMRLQEVEQKANKTRGNSKIYLQSRQGLWNSLVNRLVELNPILL